MKNILLASSSVLTTLFLSLLVIRWLAPGLLGLPVDLQLVRVGKEIAPFYESVIRAEDVILPHSMLNDPYTVNRNKPFLTEVDNYGPTDILGFRNRQVPNVADVIIIGDSQTFGNNALLEDNWPSWMANKIAGNYTYYSMATGGWGAVQYLYMFNNALIFKPRIVVVAFYTGNDALESFRIAYGVPAWNELIPDAELTANDVPAVNFPALPEEQWSVKFPDGLETVFTPNLRLVSNNNHPAVNAGYKVMEDVARRIGQKAKKENIKIIFTIIPTKELVYFKKIEAEAIQPTGAYSELIKYERSRIGNLSNAINSIDGAEYIDLVEVLQVKALESRPIYPDDYNGHPVAYGYNIIGKHIASKVKSMLPPPPFGQVAVKNEAGKYLPYVINNGVALLFGSDKVLHENGWDGKVFKPASSRDMAAFPKKVVDEVDLSRYSPEVLSKEEAR